MVFFDVFWIVMFVVVIFVFYVWFGWLVFVGVVVLIGFVLFNNFVIKCMILWLVGFLYEVSCMYGDYVCV